MVCNKTFTTFLCLIALAISHCAAFSVPTKQANADVTTRSISDANGMMEDRRAFFQHIASASLAVSGVATGSILTAPNAYASGGATAGGAYLLSAKQRYNDRVIKGIKGFLALESSLKGGSVSESVAYFAGNEVGTWGDISTSGYLLANAFRRNSTASPDSLPSVKKWKAFVKELDTMQKKLKKKDASGALASYQNAVEALDLYLAQVELPTVMELK